MCITAKFPIAGEIPHAGVLHRSCDHETERVHTKRSSESTCLEALWEFGVHVATCALISANPWAECLNARFLNSAMCLLTNLSLELLPHSSASFHIPAVALTSCVCLEHDAWMQSDQQVTRHHLRNVMIHASNLDVLVTTLHPCGSTAEQIIGGLETGACMNKWVASAASSFTDDVTRFCCEGVLYRVRLLEAADPIHPPRPSTCHLGCRSKCWICFYHLQPPHALPRRARLRRDESPFCSHGAAQYCTTELRPRLSKSGCEQCISEHG